MIDYRKQVLSNGLTVLAEQDKTTSIASINVLYNVGSKHENSSKTGLAHLFEHLMFGGSEHAPDFDTRLQLAGGENNAFTNNDCTGYYETLPVQNIETALWLEADRMAHLMINEQVLETQKKVVVEEFNEVCLNRPYGDVWHHICALSFKKHNYRWPTIGKRISHIKKTQLADIAEFYEQHYQPANAILSVCSSLSTDEIFGLAEKWFGHIPARPTVLNYNDTEPPQRKCREKVMFGAVPSPLLMMAFHIPGRRHDDYYACDIISDILASGRSSRFYTRLVKDSQLVSHIDCYLSGSNDIDLLIVEARLMPAVSMDQCLSAIWEMIDELRTDLVSNRELQKTINKIHSNILMGDIDGLSKVMSMAYFENIGILDHMNRQEELYQDVTPEDVHRVANRYMRESNLSILKYLPEGGVS